MTVFEHLRDELSCMYISDMRFGHRTTKCDREIKRCFHSLEYFLFSTDELISLLSTFSEKESNSATVLRQSNIFSTRLLHKNYGSVS